MKELLKMRDFEGGARNEIKNIWDHKKTTVKNK